MQNISCSIAFAQAILFLLFLDGYVLSGLITYDLVTTMGLNIMASMP